ncbi:MAG: nuclear transport factor 2 family protein [Microbacteriaceae bacterium]|nr:nuclear transport factor 2 family protein [Microbacteriaceae bacterium]
MSTKLRNLVNKTFRVIEAKDLVAALDGMTEGVVVIDPHYPLTRMTGKAEVAYGLGWAFADIDTFSFDVHKYFFSETGDGVAVEVNCRHVLRVGGEMSFTQAFTVEYRDGLLATLTAFEPYGPSGVPGFGLALAHFFYRLRNRRPR